MQSVESLFCLEFHDKIICWILLILIILIKGHLHQFYFFLNGLFYFQFELLLNSFFNLEIYIFFLLHIFSLLFLFYFHYCCLLISYMFLLLIRKTLSWFVHLIHLSLIQLLSTYRLWFVLFKFEVSNLVSTFSAISF